MKLVQVLLLNIVTVAVALVVYDQVRGDASGLSQVRALTPRSGAAPAAEFERRIKALEARRRAAPRAGGTGRDVTERLDALEAALRGRASPATDGARPSAAGSPAPMAFPDEPGAKEVRRFRQLREAARREDSVKKNKVRIDRVLDKLSINLTTRQRAQIHTAYAAFEPHVTRIWTEVKTQARETIAAGGEVDRGEIVTSTTALIQEEFAATLTDIVNHQADAEAIATALMAGRK